MTQDIKLPDHSPVGASGMHRWKRSACPGSVVAEIEANNNSDSFESREGSCAHEIADRGLSFGLDAKHFVGRVFHDIRVDESMAEYVQGYLDFIRAIPGDRKLTEHKFHLPQIHEMVFSTLDNAIINYSNRIAYVTDLKYGRVYVPAENNDQLKYYAFCLLVEFGLAEHIDQFVLIAYQPRLYGRLDPYETYTISTADLIRWGNEEMIPSIQLALDPNASRQAGTWCRNCSAKLTCSTFLSSAFAMAGYTTPITDELVAYVLDMEKSVNKLVEVAKEEAVTRLMSGRNIPGYKPVRQYGQSRIKNETACASELAAAGIAEDDIYIQKLKGIGKLNEIPGAKAIVAKYKERSTGGIKAAPLSSSQPAVTIAVDSFTNEGL